MREYPRMVYKSREDYKKVGDEREELQAGLEGWNSRWLPEINEKRKGTDEEILRYIQHAPEPIKEAAELKCDPEEESTHEKYEAITGLKAFCDRGPYKGQETIAFKKWMKYGSDS
jgi:hypothetical protein